MTIGILGAVIAAVLATWLARRRYALVVVRGHSMAPTLADGQRVLVRRRPPQVGDVIVFRPPRRPRPATPGDPGWRIKRVAAVNAQLVPLEVRERVGAGPASRVPAGHLVVRGDALRSEDSRHFGYVASEAVLGVVVRRLGRRPDSIGAVEPDRAVPGG